jgi:heterodisulfide reductase subunit A-like polyferredoxin
VPGHCRSWLWLHTTSISPAYIQHNQHPNIEILTNTQILDVAGEAGDFTVELRQQPTYIDHCVAPIAENVPRCVR